MTLYVVYIHAIFGVKSEKFERIPCGNPLKFPDFPPKIAWILRW